MQLQLDATLEDLKVYHDWLLDNEKYVAAKGAEYLINNNKFPYYFDRDKELSLWIGTLHNRYDGIPRYIFRKMLNDPIDISDDFGPRHYTDWYTLLYDMGQCLETVN